MKQPLSSQVLPKVVEDALTIFREQGHPNNSSTLTYICSALRLTGFPCKVAHRDIEVRKMGKTGQPVARKKIDVNLAAYRVSALILNDALFDLSGARDWDEVLANHVSNAFPDGFKSWDNYPFNTIPNENLHETRVAPFLAVVERLKKQEEDTKALNDVVQPAREVARTNGRRGF